MRTRLWLLILLLLLASAARLYRLPAQSIWFDEGWSASAAIQPTLRAAFDADPTNPPWYYLLLNIAARGFGDSEFSLRYFSLLFGILTIPLAYQLGRRLFTPRAGVGAAFLVAFSPLLWWASQEARMYTLLAMLVLVAALAWHQLLRRPTRWAWVALWTAELALLYAHNTGPIIALWLNLATFLAWIIRLARKHGWLQASIPPLHFVERGLGGEVATWLFGQVLVAILWSPWFINRFLLLPEANSALRSAPGFSLELLYQLWAALWMGSWTMVIQPETDIMTFAPVVLLLLLLASLVLIPWRKPGASWLIAHIFILTAGVVLGLGVLGNEMHGRYLVMIAPLFLVLVGAGLGEGIAWQGANRSLTIGRVPAYLSATLFLVTFIISVAFNQNPAYQHDDARGMVQYYADHLTEDDTVLAWSYADRYELAYYWDRLGVQARRVTLPEGADLDAIVPLLPTAGDVALNIWYTQRADFRGMMGCLLGNGTVNEPEQAAFYGMTNELYRAPSLQLPELRSFDVRIADIAQLSAVSAIPVTRVDQVICLPIQITLSALTSADLKAALIVQNALGWEIARDDALFADAAQRTTSMLPPSNTLTAYPLLRLPYGVPPGEYTVLLRIYDEGAQPSGYDLFVPSEDRPTRDLPLGVWMVELGANWSQVSRPPGLPVARDLALSDDLTLIADTIQGGVFRNGDELRLTLLWRGGGALPDLTLVAADDSWSVAIPAPPVANRDDVFLDWRALQIPLDAASGSAELRLPDGTLLGVYTIESIPVIYAEPEFATLLGAEFSGVGELVGYTLEQTMLDHTAPFDVTLVWRAGQIPASSYTVFVQLLDAAGQVIAQADSVPAANTRPTTGWRAGEYIVDVQQLAFNDAAQPGNARLIAGLYDPVTGVRVPLASGGDFVILRDNVEVR